MINLERHAKSQSHLVTSSDRKDESLPFFNILLLTDAPRRKISFLQFVLLLEAIPTNFCLQVQKSSFSTSNNEVMLWSGNSTRIFLGVRTKCVKQIFVRVTCKWVSTIHIQLWHRWMKYNPQWSWYFTSCTLNVCISPLWICFHSVDNTKEKQHWKTTLPLWTGKCAATLINVVCGCADGSVYNLHSCLL